MGKEEYFCKFLRVKEKAESTTVIQTFRCFTLFKTHQYSLICQWHILLFYLLGKCHFYLKRNYFAETIPIYRFYLSQLKATAKILSILHIICLTIRRPDIKVFIKYKKTARMISKLQDCQNSKTQREAAIILASYAFVH